ncbi:MAG: hypothetical protein N3B21_05320 [Clostridia bacterium]|nr:hypothetical protein [Clostridia bacterium]
MSMLKILAFIFLAAGALMVYGANWVVSKYKLNEKAVVNFANEMTEDEITTYKYNKAVLNVKMLGMLVALPGFILIMVVFR